MPFGFFFLKKKKADKVLEWLKKQSHFEDAIYFLIEKEVYENGMRDLSYTIPRLRNDAYFESLAKLALKNVQDANFEYNPRQVIQPQSRINAEIKQQVLNENKMSTEIKPEKHTAFKASSSPVVVAPSNLADLSLIDTACYDD